MPSWCASVFQGLLEGGPLVLGEEVDRVAAFVAAEAIVYLFFGAYGE